MSQDISIAKALAEAEVSDRFRMTAPTMVSSVGNCPPLSFSRLRRDVDGHGLTKKPRREDAYVVNIMLTDLPGLQLWRNGREDAVPPIGKSGIILLHMETEPIAAFHSRFDFLRFHISKTAIDELSDTTSGRVPEGLRPPEYGTVDPVLFHLASAVTPLIQRQSKEDQLLLDQLALAFHAHVTQTYAGSPGDVRPRALGGLTSWQERQAKDYLEANLSRPVSLSEVARECALSPTHFARAFRVATGRPPHRWLTERRIESAKQDLAFTDRPLSEIAVRCGFTDPSHFSRVFFKATGHTPSAWRRGYTRPYPVG